MWFASQQKIAAFSTCRKLRITNASVCSLDYTVLLSGLWSRNSNFRLRLQASKTFSSRTGSNNQNFWFRLQNDCHLKTENHCVICTTCLSRKLGLWNRNRNFRLHDLKVFSSGSSSNHPKLLGPRLRLQIPAYCDEQCIRNSKQCRNK